MDQGAGDQVSDANTNASASASTTPGGQWLVFRNRHRVYLAAVAALCVGVSQLTSRLLHWPVYLRCEGSILASASPVLGVASVAVALLLSTIAGTLLVGRLRYEAGLFAACIGLGALSGRGGTVSAALRTAGHPQVYLAMLMETVMLLGIIGLMWQLLGAMSRRGWLPPEPPGTEDESTGNLVQPVMACAIQVIVTGLLVILLAQTDSKKQVMAAVVVASLCGAIAAHQTIPVRPSVALWIGPFIVGIFGYAWALKSPGRWAIGAPANALAAATPLDYASVGVAGAIFGYWVSRQWRQGPPPPELPEDAAD
jgi:hypothetical protein